MSGRAITASVVAIVVFTLIGGAAGISAVRQTATLRAGPAAALAPADSVRAAELTHASAAETAAGVTEVTVTAVDLKLEPASLSLPASGRVRVTFVNNGALEHDWEITGLKANDVQVVSAPTGLSQKLASQLDEKTKQGVVYAAAGPKQQAVIEFTPAATGTYEMVCLVPGHKEAGMKGSVTVGDGAAAPAQQAAQPEAAPVVSLPPAKNVPPLPLPQQAPPLTRTTPTTVHLDLETREIAAQVAEGVTTTLWTFNGTVPGPLLRVLQGDTVEVSLTNAADSAVAHSIDFHAVTGPGGGAQATQTQPGQTTRFTFQALNPGVYVYHCATPVVAHHIASGMYGLIVVEPAGGLPAVDHEFYVMQGDFYLQGARGQAGHREFAMDKMLDERPDYVLFNGSVGALTGEQALQAQVGDTVRIYFGVGGPNLTSSFHVIGEIFDRVYPEGSSQAQTNVQTTLVPAGGATIVEFTAEVPGRYVLVDHSLGRLEKGGAAFLQVTGPDNPAVFHPTQAGGAE